MHEGEDDARPRSGSAGATSGRSASPVRDGIVIAAAVGIAGIAFGVLARSSGLSLPKACAMSLLVFTGASQFAAVSLIASGGGLAAAMGSALLLAARNTLYGPVVARWFEPGRPSNLLVTQVIIDESTALGAAQLDAAGGPGPGGSASPAPQARAGFLAAGIGVYVTWNLGTLLGALVGDLLGDPTRWGLDAVFPATFVALLAPHVRHRPGQVAALAAAAIALATLPVLPAGVPVLLAALGVIPGAWLRSRSGVTS